MKLNFPSRLGEIIDCAPTVRRIQGFVRRTGDEITKTQSQARTDTGTGRRIGWRESLNFRPFCASSRKNTRRTGVVSGGRIGFACADGDDVIADRNQQTEALKRTTV